MYILVATNYWKLGIYGLSVDIRIYYKMQKSADKNVVMTETQKFSLVKITLSSFLCVSKSIVICYLCLIEK